MNDSLHKGIVLIFYLNYQRVEGHRYVITDFLIWMTAEKGDNSERKLRFKDCTRLIMSPTVKKYLNLQSIILYWCVKVTVPLFRCSCCCGQAGLPSHSSCTSSSLTTCRLLHTLALDWKSSSLARCNIP